MKPAFVIDSSTELTPAMRKRRDIFVVDNYVVFDANNRAMDRVLQQMGGIDFLLGSMEDGIIPSTTQPNPNEFADVFKLIKGQGYTDVIALLLPQKKSETWNSANIARDMVPELNYFMPELRTIAHATTLVLEEAVMAYDEGYSLDILKDIVHHANSAAEAYLVVDTLKYLHANGRIGTASALMGSLLNIKPIIRLGHEGEFYGDFEPLEKIRTMKKAVPRMAELFNEKVPEGSKIIYYAGEDMERQAAALGDLIGGQFYLAKATSGAVVANVGPILSVAGLPWLYMTKPLSGQ